MKIILLKSQILAVFLFSVFMQITAFGATITSTGTGGNWNSGSSWVGGIVPTAADDVVIASAGTVTITADAAAKSISVSGTLMANDGVVFTVGSSTTSGNFTVNSGGNFSTANGSGLSTVIVYGNYINNGTTDFWKSTVIIVGDLLSPSTSQLQKQGNVVVGGNIIGDFDLTGGNGIGQIYAVNPNATVTITPVSIDNNVPPGTTVNSPPETQSFVDLVNLVLYGICPYTVSGTSNAIVCTSTPTASFTVVTSGSSPSYQWQVNSGSGWSDLTNSAPYSGVTTNTLTVTISGTGLSGNKYRAKITSGGCTKNGDYGTLTITAVAPSTPGTITGTTPQCPSNTGQIYTIAAVSGATSYTWTVPSGWTINSGNGTTSIFVTTGLVGNNGNISVTASNGCGTSAAKTLAVTVVATTVTAGTVSTSASYCSYTNSTTLTLSGTSLPIGNGAGKASVIRWESSVDDFITSTVIANTTTTLTVTDLSLTTKFRAIVLANSGGCPEDSAPATITVNANPTSIVSGTATTCSGTSKAISIALTGTGPWNLTYTDGTTSVPVTGIASSPYTFNVTPSSTKTYTVTALSDSKCTAVAADMTGSATITVNAIPTATISGTASVCQGSAAPNITFTNPQASAVTITYNINGGANTTVNVGASTTASVSTPTAVAGTFAYNLVSVAYQGSPACSTSITGTATVTVNATPSATISGTTSVCQGGTAPNITFTNPQTAAVTITYNINGGASATVNVGASTTASVSAPTVAAGTFAYNLVSVAYQGSPACSTSITGTATVTVNATPAATISGTASVCQGGTAPNITFTNPQTAAVTITYNINGGASATVNVGASTTATVSVPTVAAGTFAYNLVSVAYQGSPACSTSITGTATVTVNATPAAAISGTASVCQGGTAPNITFTNPQTAAVTITYNINGGASSSVNVGASTTATVSASTVAAGTFAYNLVSIAYQGSPACSTSITGVATITVNPIPAITGQPSGSTVCATGDTSFTVAASGLGVTYQWQLSTNGGTIFNNLSNGAPYSNVTAATMNITAATAAMNTYQYRCVVSGTCTPSVTSNAVTLNVNTDSGNISLNGVAYASNGSAVYCPSTTAVFSIAPVAGATGYTWGYPSGWAVISGQGTITLTIKTGSSAQSGTVSIMANNLFCPSYIWVALSNTPPAAPAVSVTAPTCSVPTGKIAVSSPAPGTVYTLTGTNPVVAAVTNTTGSFSGLAAGDYAVTSQTGAACVSASASATIQPLATKTWNGSWSPAGAPSLNDFVIFNADYSLPVSVNSCSCVINPGVTVTIASGLALNIINGLNVQGGLIFENNASLVQTNDNAVNQGTITYRRTTPGLKDFDYEYWSSPVAAQKLSDLWVSDRYFRYTLGNWEAQGGNVIMDVARGYIIRVRTSSPPFYQSVEFKGVPNNGLQSIRSQGVNRSNLIGNPYPSAIDGEAFIINNEAVIGGTLYFWTHYTARQLNTAGTAYIYTADDYALFNLTGGTGAAPSTNGTGVIPTGEIAAGQAFFAVSDLDDYFKFDNSLRLDSNGNIINNSQFFKPSGTKKAAKIEKDRVWLNLTNDGGAFKQLLVGYITGATNDFDKLYDGVTRNGNAFVDFYSVNNSKNYTVQGRGLPFDKTDEVPLGYKTTIAGTFQIGINNVDGGMVNQAIYLEDKMTGSIHDLKSGSYSFTTAIGTFNDRFVLRYTNTSKLGTGDVEAKGKGVFVSVRNREIKINSFDQTLASVKVYDLKGSLLYQKNKVDKNEFIIDTLNASNQFMIVMVQLEDGKWISEEIIFHD